MDAKDDNLNYLFVSDFHVAAGTDHYGAPSPREDFFFDDEFHRFVEWADSNRVNGRKWELVFVGDCFDFLPVQLKSVIADAEYWGELPGFEIPTSHGDYISLEDLQEEREKEEGMYWLRQTVSIARLALIEKGHRRFFQALGWWVGQGHRLVVMRGNHDMELYWPGVQEALKVLVWEGYLRSKNRDVDPFGGFPEKSFADRIVFDHSVFYYKKGLFYAEHGFQHEIFCAAANLLRPSIKMDDTELLIPDFGGLLVNYFVAPMEDANPTWENSSNPAKFVIEYLRKKPEQILRYLVPIKSLRRGMKMGTRIWRLINEYEDQLNLSDEELKGHAATLGVSLSLLKRLLALPERPPVMSKSPLSWFLFSYWGHIIKAALLLLGLMLGLGLVASYLLVISPAISAWLADVLVNKIPDTFDILHSIFSNEKEVSAATTLIVWVGSVITAWRIKNKVIQIIAALIVLPLRIWVWPDFKMLAFKALLGSGYDPEEHLFPAARNTEKAFRAEFNVERGAFGDIEPESSRVPRYYIFGHDHHPAAREIPGSDAVYFNTGSWLPSFVTEDPRRQRTGGLDVEFTFLEISKKKNADYAAVLRRWNDAIGMPSRQIVDPIKSKDKLAVQV